MTTRDGSTGSGTGDSPALTTDEANLEHNRKAAELVLSQLEEDLNQGTVDPELLKELGWTPEQMSRFAQRLGEQLRTPAEATDGPDDARRQQFEEMLRSLEVNQNSSTRAGDKSVVREVDQSATRRSAPPPEYRRAFDTFTRKLSKQPRPTAPGKP
jgi:hypothetical protein